MASRLAIEATNDGEEVETEPQASTDEVSIEENPLGIVMPVLASLCGAVLFVLLVTILHYKKAIDLVKI